MRNTEMTETTPPTTRRQQEAHISQSECGTLIKKAIVEYEERIWNGR